MKKIKLLFALSTSLLGCIISSLCVVNNDIVLKADEGNLTSNPINIYNTESVQTNAITINYDSTKTDIYGIQAYAGLSANAWIVADEAPIVEKGLGSHLIGSNTSDGRSNFTLTFSINSSKTEEAYLGLYGRFNDASNATFTVNGGTAQSVNLKVYEWHLAVPTLLPISLNEGLNTITLTMCENYTAWFESFYVSNTNEWLKDDHGHNDTNFYDGNAYTTTPVEITFSGKNSKVYGVQSYAGISGAAWVLGYTASMIEDNSKAKMIGSNASDGKSNLEVSFAINSTIAGEAYLNVYAEYYDDGASATNATLNVNNVTSNINFYELNGNKSSANTNATRIPITLTTGLNTVKITMQANYGIWFNSWYVSKDGEEKLPKYNQVTVASFSNVTGSMSADQFAFGLNAFDNVSDYGKTGSLDYVFTCDEAGDYYLKVNAMAGNALANRMKITVNDVIFQEDNHDYVSLNTSAGWSGDSSNTYKISLNGGTNTITFSNELTTVNESKTSEVTADELGSIKVSNWWVHGISLEKVPNEELIIDTSDAKTVYNLNRAFSSEGIKVYHKVDDVSTLLTSDKYNIDSSRFVSSVFGSYEIKVNMLNSSLSTSYYVSVSDNGQEFEGMTIEFDGQRQKHSFYNYAKIEGQGTDECENRIFWYSNGQGFVLDDGGYQFGSAGEGAAENRQVTLSMTIDSSVTGTYLFKAYVVTNDRNNSTLKIKINDENEYDASLFYSSATVPYIFSINLKEGINTVKLTTYNKYNFWWNYFELAPIEYKQLNDKANAIEGIRWGKDLIDCEVNDVWQANNNERSLTYYYTFENDGDYLLKLNTNCSSDKDAIIYVDDKAYNTTIKNGVTSIPFSATKGNHSIKIYASGTNSDFSLSSIEITKDIKPVSIIIDTSNSNLTIPYDGILDTTTITAKIKYSDESFIDLSPSEFKIVKDINFSEIKPGTYQFNVIYKDDETIYTTFSVTVLEEVKDDTPSSPSVLPSDSPSVDNNQTENNSKGCKGSVATSLITFAATLGLLIIRKRKED